MQNAWSHRLSTLFHAPVHVRSYSSDTDRRALWACVDGVSRRWRKVRMIMGDGEMGDVDEAAGGEDWTPTFRRAVALVGRLYELEAVAGPLHVEVDDGNLDGQEIVPCYEFPGYPDRYSAETHEVCDELAALLTAMTPPQRRAVIAAHWACRAGSAAERA